MSQFLFWTTTVSDLDSGLLAVQIRVMYGTPQIRGLFLERYIQLYFLETWGIHWYLLRIHSRCLLVDTSRGSVGHGNASL